MADSTEKPVSVVISRSVGEAIHIGDDIVVRVDQIEAAKVRLLIEAPNTIPVQRGEVAAAIWRHLTRVRDG